MNFERQPQIGSWYRRSDRIEPFQVVAIDSDARTVELEYFDGTVDEWPLTHWYGLEIEPCDAPIDARGAFDQLDPDGLATDEVVVTPEDWEAAAPAADLDELAAVELEVPLPTAAHGKPATRRGKPAAGKRNR